MEQYKQKKHAAEQKTLDIGEAYVIADLDISKRSCDISFMRS